MNARQILQKLKAILERDTEYSSENYDIHITGDKTEALAVIQIPVEGKTRLIEIKTRELGPYLGLIDQNG